MNRFLKIVAKSLCVMGLSTTLLLSQAQSQSQTQMQDKPMTEQNILNLDATVSAPITPDTAVVTMSAERTGADAALITQEVNALMASALREAKALEGIEAATGNFSTYPQYDNKGQPNGWVVRYEMILKSKDFVAIGKLVGGLSKRLKITSNGFEVSRELKKLAEDKLVQLGLASFQSKALVAAKALGFSGYTLRQVSLQQALLEGNQPRPMMMAMSARGAADSQELPVEAGRTALNLTVSGSVQLK